ncbi:DUF3768 domain-containing protein [bacterium]|nr:DUF3768 domain-containing protein [bacterium]
MSPRIVQIADLNDLLRTTFLTGKVVFTQGIAALSEGDRAAVLTAVREFRDFTPDNDPNGERDFGSIELEQVGRVIWKIDYYDPDYRCHSPDPVDPQVTRRVLTIMLAEEY